MYTGWWGIKNHQTFGIPMVSYIVLFLIIFFRDCWHANYWGCRWTSYNRAPLFWFSSHLAKQSIIMQFLCERRWPGCHKTILPRCSSYSSSFLPDLLLDQNIVKADLTIVKFLPFISSWSSVTNVKLLLQLQCHWRSNAWLGHMTRIYLDHLFTVARILTIRTRALRQWRTQDF
jgi:hypothetical protein